MPRKPIEKPAVTEIVVDEEKVVSRVKEPKQEEKKPPKQFGLDLDFLGLFKKK